MSRWGAGLDGCSGGIEGSRKGLEGAGFWVWGFEKALGLFGRFLLFGVSLRWLDLFFKEG